MVLGERNSSYFPIEVLNVPLEKLSSIILREPPLKDMTFVIDYVIKYHFCHINWDILETKILKFLTLNIKLLNNYLFFNLMMRYQCLMSRSLKCCLQRCVMSQLLLLATTLKSPKHIKLIIIYVWLIQKNSIMNKKI